MLVRKQVPQAMLITICYSLWKSACTMTAALVSFPRNRTGNRLALGLPGKLFPKCASVEGQCRVVPASVAPGVPIVSISVLHLCITADEKTTAGAITQAEGSAVLRSAVSCDLVFAPHSRDTPGTHWSWKRMLLIQGVRAFPSVHVLFPSVHLWEGRDAQCSWDGDEAGSVGLWRVPWGCSSLPFLLSVQFPSFPALPLALLHQS